VPARNHDAARDELGTPPPPPSCSEIVQPTASSPPPTRPAPADTVNYLPPGADAPTRRQAWRRPFRRNGPCKGVASRATERAPALPQFGGGGRRLPGGLPRRRVATRTRRRGRSAVSARARDDGAARGGAARGGSAGAALGRGPADRRGPGRRCRAGAHREREQVRPWTGGEAARLGIQARRERTRGYPWDRQQENDLSFLSDTPPPLHHRPQGEPRGGCPHRLHASFRRKCPQRDEFMVEHAPRSCSAQNYVQRSKLGTVQGTVG